MGVMRDARLVTVTDIDELYRRERPGLVRLAFLMTGSMAAAEDALHDAIVRTQPRLATGSVDNPGAYLRTAVVNAARDRLRRRRTEPLATEPAIDGLDTRTVELFDSLRVLSDRRRAAVILRYWADLSVAEVADVLECRPGTVSSLLHRALADLRRELNHDD